MSRAAQSQPQSEPQPPTPASNQSPSQTPSAPATGGTSPRPGVPRRFQTRQDGPRRVRDGLRLSSREGPVARTPLALRWLGLIEAHVPSEHMMAGIEYARAGQIVSLQVSPGMIEAPVQGTAPRPYSVRITLATFSEAQWQQVIEAMAVEAIHHAKLLAGEIPPAIDQTLDALNLSLLPDADGVTMHCTCATGSASAGACKHTAATSALFADQLSNNPLLIFGLRGMPADRLIERLRQQRAIHTHGVAAAHGEADIPGSQVAALPLETMLDDFWHGSGDLESIVWQAPASAVPHALLRRLGPSPLQGRFPMAGLMASIYDAVAAEARKRRAVDAAADEDQGEPRQPAAGQGNGSM